MILSGDDKLSLTYESLGAAETPNLEVRNLNKRFGSRVILEDVNVQFRPGLTLLKGPSGAGKSLLLRLLASAEKPTNGEIFWKQQSVSKNLRRFRKTLGYAPQAVDLPDELTAEEFTSHMAAQKGLDLRSSRKQVEALTHKLGLRADLNRRIATFSGGMRRRLVLIQALLGRPELLILDEPTAELDTESRCAVVSTLQDYCTRSVVLMTTHTPEDLVDHKATCLRLISGRLCPE